MLEPLVTLSRTRFTGASATRFALLLLDLGAARTSLATTIEAFNTAEANLLESHEILLRLRGEKHRDTRRCARALADLYAARHALDPSKGDDTKAAEWKTRAGEM